LRGIQSGSLRHFPPRFRGREVKWVLQIEEENDQKMSTSKLKFAVCGLAYALSSTAATSTRKDRQWESAMDAALADPNHDNWVTVSTAHVNTKTTAIINEPSSSASTGAASASGQDRDFFNPHTVEHLSVTGKTAEQGPSDGSADIVTEDEMPPCPDGADCPESESKASNLAANPAANPGTMETEATAVAQTEASKATNDATANGKTIISSADAKNDMKGPEKPVRDGNNDQEIQFSPEPEDGNAPPARTSATGNATGNAGAQPHKAPKFLHDIMHRHKKRHARLLDIKNKAAAFKKEIHAIKKAHEKDKQLLAAHKKKSGGKMAGHVQKHEQDVVKMGKEINQILKIVQGMANQMKTQKQDQSAAASPAAEDEDAEEDAEKDVEKDATANEDAAAAKEEEEEDAEEDADDQAAAKAEEKQDKVDEESEDKDEGESRIFLCILCVCVFVCFVQSIDTQLYAIVRCVHRCAQMPDLFVSPRQQLPRKHRRSQCQWKCRCRQGRRRRRRRW
jgi:hypothetical protein